MTLYLTEDFQMKTYSGTVESIVFWNEEMLFISERKGNILHTIKLGQFNGANI